MASKEPAAPKQAPQGGAVEYDASSGTTTASPLSTAASSRPFFSPLSQPCGGAALSSARSTATSTRVRLVECGPLSQSPQVWGPTPQVCSGRNNTHHLNWARTPAGSWVRVHSSTAVFPNRERDKRRVENSLGLPEFGDTVTEFYAVKSELAPVALGYDRIVYGDHGPYVELSSHQICWQSFPNYVERPQSCFFDECWTSDDRTMMYAQKRPVTNKPNPPMGPYSVQNNRAEGYANYQIGKFYISCDVNTIAVQRASGMPRRRRRAGRGQSAKGAGKGGANARWDEGEAGDFCDDAAAADDAEAAAHHAYANGCGEEDGSDEGASHQPCAERMATISEQTGEREDAPRLADEAREEEVVDDASQEGSGSAVPRDAPEPKAPQQPSAEDCRQVEADDDGPWEEDDAWEESWENEAWASASWYGSPPRWWLDAAWDDGWSAHAWQRRTRRGGRRRAQVSAWWGDEEWWGEGEQHADASRRTWNRWAPKEAAASEEADVGGASATQETATANQPAEGESQACGGCADPSLGPDAAGVDMEACGGCADPSPDPSPGPDAAAAAIDMSAQCGV